jgi:demethylmenaquinone methyltransferase/2-methoxy-6-polyprenyl-1,4-benzoquinol methylase/ArsR family transcriptional regulator
LAQAGLEPVLHRELAPTSGENAKLTVSLWLARDPRVIADPAPAASYEAA